MPAGRRRRANFDIEQIYMASGHRMIAGIDEAGRGAWAGPVSAGAVVLPVNAETAKQLHGVRDSKLMTPRQRERLYAVIPTVALAWGVGAASVAEIAAMGIAPATRLAMRRALLDMMQRACHILPDVLFIDYVKLDNAPLDCPQVVRSGFDADSLSVACASIMAKQWRDLQMHDLDARHPGYGFGQHKGYGTAQHSAALATLGACDAHRGNFQPVLQRRLL